MKNFKETVRFVLLLFVFQTSVLTQQPNASPQSSSELPDARAVYHEKLEAGNNYLAPLLQLRRREAEYLAAPPQLRANFLEYIILLDSFVGDFDAAYIYEEKFLADLEPRVKLRARNAAEIKQSPLEGYAPRPALDAIGAAADKHQIVVVNEEHRTPVHRALTHRLLSVLYAKGFRYLALETLRADDTELNKRGYPTHKSGYYTFDPVFGDIVRQAIKLGFKTVAYENEKNCSKPQDFLVCANEREFNQAQNVYDRILKDDPKAKILIHAGRGHAAKGEVQKGFAFMAQHLWNISRIEPFTVDQLAFSERHNPADETPLYRYVTGKKLLLAEPTVFESSEKKFYTEKPRNYDLQIFTPPARYANGRPDWQRLGGARKEYRLNLKKLNLQTEKQKYKAAAPVLVQAFVAGESADAIPVDQVILYPGKEIPSLMLPKGSIQIKAVDETGKIIRQYEIKQK